MRSARGQSTVEWVGMLSLVSLLLVGMLAAGVRAPGTALADSIFEKLLCAVSMAESCGDEPHLIAAYGTEVGKLADDHMPSILFEKGSRALPVNFRRCRDTACADGPQRGLVRRSDSGLPVAAFVHVIDCRPGKANSSGADCSGERAGNLYVQYWTYYADSATLRDVGNAVHTATHRIPLVDSIAGRPGYHEDDWEGVQVRIRPDGSIDQRASSHHGYNYARGISNAGADAGIDPLKGIAEAIGARARNGWGPETRLLLVSGGSHAGNSWGIPDSDRVTPGDRVHLIPMERLLATGHDPRFAVVPPWLKRVWRDPEAEGTD
jgi:hypothetical protein